MTLQQHDKCLQTDFSPRGQIGPHPHYTYLQSYKHRNAELRDSAWALKLPVTRSPLRHTETRATATHFKACMYNFQPARHVPAQLNEVTLTPCLWMLRVDETQCVFISLFSFHKAVHQNLLWHFKSETHTKPLRSATSCCWIYTSIKTNNLQNKTGCI